METVAVHPGFPNGIKLQEFSRFIQGRNILLNNIARLKEMLSIQDSMFSQIVKFQRQHD